MVLALLVNGCGRPEVQELDFSAIEGESGSNGFEPSRQMEESEEERRQKLVKDWKRAVRCALCWSEEE